MYGLGAILYALLTGRPPFLAASPIETLRRVIDEEPAAQQGVDARIGRDLEAICLKAIAKSPGLRYPTAMAMADDLNRYFRGEPVAARLAGPIDRLGRWCGPQSAAGHLRRGCDGQPGGGHRPVDRPGLVAVPRAP